MLYKQPKRKKRKSLKKEKDYNNFLKINKQMGNHATKRLTQMKATKKIWKKNKYM
jgi:hypothetical protein